MEAIYGDDSHDDCTTVDVVEGISSTMVVAGMGCFTSIVRSMIGDGGLIFDFLVARFFTCGVQMTCFFYGLGTIIWEGA